MEVRFTPELEKKLKDFASESGLDLNDLVQSAVSTYIDGLAEIRRTLDSRYDDLKSGRVKPIDGETARALLHEKTEQQRRAKTVG